jgi:hypothetical protein
MCPLRSKARSHPDIEDPSLKPGKNRGAWHRRHGTLWQKNGFNFGAFRWAKTLNTPGVSPKCQCSNAKKFGYYSNFSLNGPVTGEIVIPSRARNLRKYFKH